ncbi:flatoxin efflux pump [Diaporthe amygdali]|uniref:flatoxin efflux pump n=1 Tax=Phomopsis amygdali TaxID=1214568 RepID=UPI0022FF2E72|nr:flatoxin efflux pump [Diaporthe amygdali]KAJ0122202.1 flatoxin efflux pump [Diaporthe amygdali]
MDSEKGGNNVDLADKSDNVVTKISSGGEAQDSIVYPNVFWTSCVSFGVALGLFLVGLDMTIIATAIPKITEEFPGVNLIGWYSSAFFISLACTQPFWGKVYPFFSIKYTFLLVVFIFGVGALIGGLAPNSTVLILGRAILGASAAGIAAGGYAILGVTVRPGLRPVFTGLINTVYSLASVLGPILGGAFTQHSTWRWCFFVNLPVAGVSALVILLLFHPPPASSRSKVPLKVKMSHMDPVGILLVLGSLVCFTRAVEVAGIHQPWGSGEVIGLFVGSGIAAVAFVVSQYLQGDHALLVSRLVRQRGVYVSMGYGFFHEGAFVLLLYYIPIYFQVVDGISPTEAGFRNLPMLISCGIGSALTGLLVSRSGYYTPFMVWASAGGCIGAGLIYTLDETSPPAKWIGYQVLAGLAFGSGLPLGIISGQANAEQEDIPSRTAMLLFSFCVGSSTSLGTGQSVFSNLILTRLPALAPGVDPITVINTGATDIRNVFPADAVPGIVQTYLYALRAVFTVVTAYAGVAVMFAISSRWERLNLKG